jgi:hypothetical protein
MGELTWRRCFCESASTNVRDVKFEKSARTCNNNQFSPFLIVLTVEFSLETRQFEIVGIETPLRRQVLNVTVIQMFGSATLATL